MGRDLGNGMLSKGAGKWKCRYGWWEMEWLVWMLVMGMESMDAEICYGG